MSDGGTRERFDAVIIGGGFYGLRIALFLRESLGFDRVVVLEAGEEFMARASYANQARVHNGYHYPRSILTGYRSRVNFPSFSAEYRDAIVDRFPHYYGIARMLSKTNARQFELFCKRIGASVGDAPDSVLRFFDRTRIEQLFRVEEPSFDSRVLRRLLLDRITAAGGIELRLGATVDGLVEVGDGLEVQAGGESFRSPRVISAVYAQLNGLHAAIGLPPIDLQHELTELALVELPAVLGGAAFTVMDGPFFSMMPFPSRDLHTLSHVRYTPHVRWRETDRETIRDPYHALEAMGEASNYSSMYADVVRYMPGARAMRYRDSLFEAKTVLARTAVDDSRPILFRPNHGLRGYTCVMGGKLDNIYDVLTELEQLYEAR